MADGDVVRRITISATGEGIDSTKSSVDGLSSSVSGLTDTLSGFGSSFSGLSAILSGGVIAGFAGLLDYVAKANKDLADMSTTAGQVGLTLKDLQGLQFGGALTGLDTDQVNAGLQQSATLLNDASRNSNSLSKELAANGIAIKSSNGDLISQNQLLTIAGGLIANAKNPGDENAIAQMLGFTKEWIPLLEQVGTTGMGAIQSAAQAAGAVIDDATVQKAKEFDTEWRKSSVEWSAYMKSMMADILPYVDDLIQRSQTFMQNMQSKGGGIQGILGNLGPALTIGSGDNKRTITINTDNLHQALQDFQSASIFSLDYWSKAGQVFSSSVVIKPASDYPAPQDAINSDFGAIQKQNDLMKQSQAAADAWEKSLISVPSVVAPKVNDANDAYDRAVISLQKHTAQQVADTQAVSLGAGALSEAQAQAKLLSAAQAAGDPITQKMTDQMQDLSLKAGAAADALAKANTASTISRGSQLAFASPEDVQIANQLKGIYGNDIPAALASSEAAALRMNDALKSMGDLARSAATSFATTLVSGLEQGKSLTDSLKASATQLSSTLTNKAFTDLFSGNFLQAGAEGIGAIVTGLLGSGSDTQIQQRADARQQVAQEVDQATVDAANRRATDNQNQLLAGVDQNTLQGQLTAFDIDAQNQRVAEANKGNGAIVELEKSLAAQRLEIIDKSNAAITSSMDDFLNSVKTGSQSTLSPADQLAYEQNLFNTQLAGAKGGDSTDLNALTSTASALLTLAQNFYASGTGYADTYKQVTDAISAIAANPNQNVSVDGNVTGITQDTQPGISVSPDGEIYTATGIGASLNGMAEGGIVGNGTYNRDSVVARYAGGGSIALAGGEAVTRATSVNANTIGMLNHINKTGKTPGNDNSDVVRVLTQGFNGQTAQIVSAIGDLSNRVKALEDTTRQTNNKRRVPGTKAA